MSSSRGSSSKDGSKGTPESRRRRSAWDWLDMLLLGPGAREGIAESDMQAAILSASAGFPAFPSYRCTPAVGEAVAVDTPIRP